MTSGDDSLPPSENRPEETEQPLGSPSRKTHERHLVYGTWALAAGTFALASVAYCTMQDARKAADQTHTDNIAALGKADEANKTSRESFTAVQRAFLTISNVKMDHAIFNPSPGVNAKNVKSILFAPVAKNTGNTPALYLQYLPIYTPCYMEMNEITAAMRPHLPLMSTRFRQLLKLGNSPAGCATLNSSVMPTDPENDFRGRLASTSAVLGPHDEIILGGVEIADTFLEYMMMHNIHSFIYGIISYNDIFPNSQRHTTKYCYEIGTAITQKGTIQPSAIFCAHWNCADEQCKEDRAAYDEEIAKSPSSEVPPK